MPQSINSSSKDLQKQKLSILTQLDQLPFSRWHLFMVISLGLVWIFDGYEVSLISLFRKYIVKQYNQNHFKSLATSYQIGCIFGSFIFGVSAFIYGRRRIFIITIFLYFIGILLSLVPDSLILFIFARFIIGISVGGQFTAIFTAIDEFLPPKYRGRVNIGIDGTWHLGASLAAILNIIIGETEYWRYFFTFGILGTFSLFFMRKNIPQSPRWFISKGKFKNAESIVKSIGYAVNNKNILLTPNRKSKLDNKSGQFNVETQLDSQRSNANSGIYEESFNNAQPNSRQNSFFSTFFTIFRTVWSTFKNFKQRFLLALFLMFSQAFFFNLVYYKFPVTLENKFHLQQEQISSYMLPLSLSSFISTLIVGPLFDKIGRKQLLLTTCIFIFILIILDVFSGVLLIISDYLQDLFWIEVNICIMFFFTSPAGSSANLIASEIFPTSSRTLILFIMFIIGMVGGIGGVWFDTVWVGSLLMIIAGIIGYVYCPKAENKSLEEIQSL